MQGNGTKVHIVLRYCINILVPPERVFTAAGIAVNRLRTRLTPEHVDMLIFLNKNMQVG